jgi:CHAD domain-containing protein
MKAGNQSVTLLQRRIRVLTEALPGAISGDPAALHRARVATRRLREALPVAGAGVNGGKRRRVRRLVRRLTRALGTVRELDVALQILEERADAEDAQGSAIDRARGLVRLERQARREEMLRRLSRINPEKLQRRLADFVTEVEASPAEAWRRALAARLAHRSRRLDQAISRAGSMYVPVTLHAVRIAAKKLRYALELAAESGIPEARPHVTTVKRAQTALGRLQDLQVVLRQVDRASAERGLDPPSRAGLAILARSLEEDARRAHGRYLRFVPRLTTVAAAARQRIVPSLTAAIRRRPARMKARLRQGDGGQAQRRAAATVRRTTTAWHGRTGQRKQA